MPVSRLFYGNIFGYGGIIITETTNESRFLAQ
jgi:hypothetical protein